MSSCAKVRILRPGLQPRPYGSTSVWPAGLSSGTTYQLSGLTGNVIPALVSAGELKASFTANSAVLPKLYVNAITTTGSEVINVCFQPASKSFQTDSNTKYTSAGGAGAGCTTAVCFWCLK